VRVLAVSTWYPSAEQPGETPFVARHVRALTRHHDVRVAHVRLMRTGPVLQEHWEGVPVVRIPLHPGRPVALLRAYRQLWHEVRGSDLVHSMAFSTALVLAPFARARPWVHTEHWAGVTAPERVGGLWARTAWLRHVLRLPDLLTGVSEAMCSSLQRFARAGRVRAWGNVVDHDPEVTPPPGGATVELVAVGRLTATKDPLLAVEAVDWIRRQGRAVHLVWCGGGPLEEQARHRAAELGLGDAVEFIGNVPPAEVRRRLAQADVFLLPSHIETFCVAAAEALAAGRPAVMGAVGGQTEFIDAGNGRLVAERTGEAFGRAVLECLEPGGVRPPEQLAATIRQRYGPEAVSDEIDRLYPLTVAEHRSRGLL
jgi:glycosyltransferase involved in cell wall biosynthesis